MKKASRYTKCLYRSFTIALAALVLYCILCAVPVIAAPVLRLSSTSGPVGTQITITGTVFNSFEGDSIHILFDSVEIASPIIVPAGGAFTVTCTIPADATGGAHIIGAKRETTDSSFVISCPFTVDPRELTLSINEGPTGTALEISGSGFYINETVTINYFNPAAGPIGTLTASSLGKFTRSYTVPAGTAGNHRFTATNARGNTAEIAYKVIPDIVLNVNSGAPGEHINVRGTGFGATTSAVISLDTTSVATVQTDALGSLETQFVIPQLTVATHYLKVRDTLGNKIEVAFPVTPGAVLSNDTGSTGSPVTVNGNGFESGSSITVTYDDKPVGTAIADRDGKFTVTFDIPSGNGGDHLIKVSDGVTTREYSYTVETVPPPVPSPVSPADNTLTSAFTTLNWQPVTDPSVPVTYILQISTDEAFTTVILEKSALPGTQYILAVNEALTAEPPVSAYYWRVMAVDGAGNRGAWSDVWSFFVGVPPTVTLISPTDGVSAEFPIALNWEPAASLSGTVTYHLQVSRNAEFSELLVDQNDLASTVYTISEQDRKIFDQQIPYYWKVRAIDGAGNAGTWSGNGSFNLPSSGFPAWAAYLLVGFGVIIITLLAFRIGRRTAYH
jgi:hypothetical protein